LLGDGQRQKQAGAVAEAARDADVFEDLVAKARFDQQQGLAVGGARRHAFPELEQLLAHGL
jgi:hypothetical protein